MGCDIHTWVEFKTQAGKWKRFRGSFTSSWEGNAASMDWMDIRSYRVFGFLAGVRNYAASPVIREPKGWPADMSPDLKEVIYDDDLHTKSWITAAELINYDYDQIIEDRRVGRWTGPKSFDGGCTAEPGGGQIMTMREFLGEYFFDQVKELAAVAPDPNDVRVVFAFDN